jgi:hypothetical protein
MEVGAVLARLRRGTVLICGLLSACGPSVGALWAPSGACALTAASASASAAAQGLPDGRVYELVSPVDKSDGEVYRVEVGAGDQASLGGEAMAYVSLAAFPGSPSAGIFYLASREANGWSSQNLVPPQSPGDSLCVPEYLAYSADLSKGILTDGGSECGQDSPPLVNGEPQGVANLFVRDNSDGSYRLVDVTPANVTPESSRFEGVSADFNHVFFSSTAQLAVNAPSEENLYEWSGGAVSLVGLFDNEPLPGAQLGDGPLGSHRLHAVSEDGSRVFFTANGNLYLRERGTTTTQIDAAQGPGAGGGGQFMTASADGSKVFFIDNATAGLTNSTVAGSGANLYEYDVNDATLTDLTPGATAAVMGVLGASEDGSYVYYAAEGALAGAATAGQPNLLVEHDGTTTFIGTLDAGDSSDWSANGSARVTPDGTHLAFDSLASLTGYDNTDANTASPDTEVFLYDAVANQLSCASCNPSGASPIGSSSIEAGNNPDYVQRNLSADGSRLFFNSEDALSPRAIDGKQNVYEYEHGQVYLISSGTSSDDSTFLDASSSGDDVFFRTREQLVAQDTDDGLDVYDARVGGGFPTQPAPTGCQGEECLGPLSTAPTLPSPGSALLAGLESTPSGASSKAVELSIASVGAAARRRVAKTGRLMLRIVVPHKGTVEVVLRAKIGKRAQIVGAGTVRASKAGIVRIEVALDRAARALLHEHGLKVAVAISLADQAAHTTVRLSG